MKISNKWNFKYSIDIYTKYGCFCRYWFWPHPPHVTTQPTYSRPIDSLVERNCGPSGGKIAFLHSMNPVRLYHFGTLLLAFLLSLNAGAQSLKPQVESESTALPVTTQAPLTPWSGTVPAVSPAPVVTPPIGQPIVYPSVVPPAASNPQVDQELNALMNAFNQLMSGMGGGIVTGPRSEIVDSGHSGGSGAGGYGSTGGSTPVGAAELGGPRKIIPPFRKWFGECTKKYGDCKFENWGIMGDASHRARRSCHNGGDAIDVGPITCSGGQSFKASSEQFFSIAKCMANDSNNELQVIFYKAEGPNMMRKSDHSGHMHVQLKNCKMVYGQ